MHAGSWTAAAEQRSGHEERNALLAKTASHAQWSLEPYSIGLKLRALRTQKRLTLARLAAETGLSTALLSKLETDRMIPTLPTLAAISRVYGVGMGHFFAEPSRHTLSITRKAHFEAIERGMEQLRITPLNPVNDEGLVAGHTSAGFTDENGIASANLDEKAGNGTRRGPRLVAQMIEFPAAGAASASDSFRLHAGLIYVLEGELRLDSGGLHELLETGDCAYLETDMALMWSAVGKQRCRILAVFPGESAGQMV